MTVLEFLESVRGNDQKMRALESRIVDLRIRMTNLSSPQWGDKVQTSHMDGENLVDKYLDKMSDLSREWDYYNELEKQANDLVRLAGTTDRQVVLYRYYIMGQDYPQIAEEMNFSERRVFQLRAEGLDDISFQKSAVNCSILQ